MGEADTCRPIHDPLGVIADLKRRTRPYPGALRDSLIARFGWEAGFAIDNAELAARRAERTHVAGCAYRALCCTAQVIFALNDRYLINEKGAVAEAAECPITIDGLAEAETEIWKAVGDGRMGAALDVLNGVWSRLKGLLRQA
jgi:hypothetical protein